MARKANTAEAVQSNETKRPKPASRQSVVLASAPEIPLAPSRTELKLDLGCGQNPKEGFEGVDLYAPNPKHRIDLFKFPFPWADNSVDEIHCSHFLEHLPAREVLVTDQAPNKWAPDIVGQDFLFAFMDECWRVLKPNGTMTIQVPNARHNRGFQDPTHRRFFVQETFFYFWADWRKANGLDHYRARCNFAGQSVVPIVLTNSPTQLRHADVQAEIFNGHWNEILDWHAVLVAIK